MPTLTEALTSKIAFSPLLLAMVGCRPSAVRMSLMRLCSGSDGATAMRRPPSWFNSLVSSSNPATFSETGTSPVVALTSVAVLAKVGIWPSTPSRPISIVKLLARPVSSASSVSPSQTSASGGATKRLSSPSSSNWARSSSWAAETAAIQPGGSMTATITSSPRYAEGRSRFLYKSGRIEAKAGGVLPISN